MPHRRQRYVFRGQVQGVGFRATTRQIARIFDVVGYVRNLEDGRVEVVTEGESEEISSFIETIGQQFNGMIRGVDREDEIPTDETFEGFTIRY